MARDDDDFPSPPTRKADDEPEAKNEPKSSKRTRPSKVTPIRAKDRDKALDDAERFTDDFQARVVRRIAPWAPVVGGYWATRAEANTRAVLTIAAGRPKFLAAIVRAIEVEAYFDLGEFAIGLAVAVAVEMRAAPADGRMAASFGIDEIWAEVEKERAEVEQEVASHYRSIGEDDDGAGPLPGLMGELTAS